MTVIAGATDCSTPNSVANRLFNNLRYDNPWQASQGGVKASPSATLACPTVPNGIGYRCTAITTGITGGSEPTWPVILGNSVVDGGVTWTAQDVANPSGKAHPPAGAFGYAPSASDLDAFRLLAYDEARAFVDSANAEKWDGATQVVGGGGGGGAVVAYEVDFTTLATVDFKAGGDGNYTIGGKVYYVSGTTGCTTYKLLNGTGITATSAVGSNPAIAGLHADIAYGGNPGGVVQFVPSYAPGRTNVELWVRVIHPNPMGSGAGANAVTAGLYTWNPATLTVGATTGPSGGQWGTVTSENVFWPSVAASSFTDDVFVVRMVGGVAYAYSGVWSAGWPAPSALNARGAVGGMPVTASGIGFYAHGGIEGDLAMSVMTFVNYASVNTITLTNMRIVTF